MLERIKYVAGIGRFESAAAKVEFAPLTLIYAQNGKGKSTLSDILRSLASGDPTAVLRRARLGATSPPKVVMQLSQGDVVFEHGKWSATDLPTISVFDEQFVNKNIFSGIQIDPEHRKNLHHLVIGHQGVVLDQRVNKVTDEINGIQTEIRITSQAFDRSLLAGFSVERFCALEPTQDLDEEIERAEQNVAILRDAQVVKNGDEFEGIRLPLFDRAKLEQLANATLDELQADAVKAVRRHLSALGEQEEDWLRRGVELSDGREDCPFCGQSLDGVELLEHYQAYFSSRYKQHLELIQDYQSQIDRTFGSATMATFQRAIQKNRERHQFWQTYVDTLPDYTPDLDFFATTWTTFSEQISEIVARKLRAPLDRVDLGADTRASIEAYAHIEQSIDTDNLSLHIANELIRAAKEKASNGDFAVALGALRDLQSRKKRFEPDVDERCRSYLTLTRRKANLERERAEARRGLDEYRSSVFPTYQTRINRHLATFNAGFRIQDFAATNPRGGTSSAFQILVNEHPVPLSSSGDPHQPDFASTLSAGDRNTLALAFFFSHLDDLDRDTIVVIDEPSSSLDDARSVVTAQEIRALSSRFSQVIVLSHVQSLLCEIWNFAKDEVAALCIQPSGSNSSVIGHWDISDAAVTQHDLDSKALREFIASPTQNQCKDVAQLLRPLLESFLRVACPKLFPPGQLLGQFITQAKQAAQNGDPVISVGRLSELENLNTYASRFHHETRLWRSNLNAITFDELFGYAKRVATFISLL